ncbi:MAG: BspA family leucine-rich repeat surface protein [Bacilli bacterium]|nr:BspA family leucine-rich repeat surface protein [Bacilli bacterium]
MKIYQLIKKIIISIVLTMLFLVSVKAFSTNLKEVKVVETNMKISNISNNDNIITDDIIFEEKDDYIMLEFILQNNDNDKYTIEDIFDNNSNENIKITYDYSKEKINEKSQYKFKAKLEYKKRLENVKEINIDDLKVTVRLLREDGKTKDILIRNPKTGDSILYYLLLVILALVALILIKVKKKKIIGYPIFILLVTVLIPMGIFAVQRYEYNIFFKNIKVKGIMVSYNVRFHILDKEPITKIIKHGEEISTFPEVDEEDYSLIEWEDEDGNVIDEHTIVTRDMDVYAKLDTINIDNKIYIYDGFGKATSASTKTGSAVTLTYYSDSTCSTKTTTSNATEEGGTPKAVGTYYAIGKATINQTEIISKCKNAVEINNAKITFDPNEGILNGINPLYTRKGDTKVYTGIKNSIEGTIPIATKEGYIFEGWYTSPTGSSKVINPDGTLNWISGYTFDVYGRRYDRSLIIWELTSDETLYAHWKEKIATLDTGMNINKKLKQLAGNTSASISSNDNSIKSIQRTTIKPDISTMTSNNIISLSDSDIPVYAWYDNGIIYYYSDAKTIYMNSDSSYIFDSFKSLQSVDLSTLNSSNVTTMAYMFYNCTSLESLDVTHFNTSKVKSMFAMFQNCSSLTTLDVTHFNTKNVEYMNYMFQECRSLKSLDVTHFNTSKVTNMISMFAFCNSLTSLDLSNFNTSKVTNMWSMFIECTSLSTLDLSSFDTSKVTNMISMFDYCTGLTSVNLSSFDTSKVTNMYQMFYNCNSLTSLDLNNFDTSKVTDMERMFADCSSLTNLNISNFDTSNVTTMAYIFRNCENLTEIDLSSFDTRNLINSSGIFYHCKNLTEIDLSSFDTSKATSMYNMFEECTNLTTIYASEKFVTTNLSNVDQDMFEFSTKLVGGEGSTNLISDHDEEFAHIDGGTSNPGYFTYKAYSGPTGANISKFANLFKSSKSIENMIVLVALTISLVIIGVIMLITKNKKED